MNVEKKVTRIPATTNPVTRMPSVSRQRRRVVGYARVSTDKDEQFTSYTAQIDYYTKYIQGHVDWQFVNVYTDEGISGTNTKHRDGFNQMIDDALAGKIDLIVTKSISRFARNTVDSLVTIRKLKEANVECFFEKENIYTFDSKGEVLITIMSKLIKENSTKIMDQDDYNRRYDDFVERYNSIKDKLDDLERKKNRRPAKANSIGCFMFELMEQDGILAEFDERLFTTVIDTTTVHPDGRMTFRFRVGVETEN